MKGFRKFLAAEKNHAVLIPLIAVLFGFLLGAVILLISGENPLILFKSMIRAVFGVNLDRIGTGKKVFSVRLIGEYFVYVMPIVLTGLSVAFSFRTGMFNIGAEGQLLMGAAFATVVGVTVNAPAFVLLPLVVLAGIIGGGLWGFIPGYLKAKFNVHEVVVTIMLNYAGMYIANYILLSLPGSTTSETVALHDGALLKSTFLSSLTGNSRFHFGFVIVILAILVFWFIINKTTFGYELKSVGYNPFAASYAGMQVRKDAALSMVISGAFAGLAGVVIVCGTFGRGRILPFFENYGFDGITVALVGGNTALGSLFGALLLGALKAAQPLMQGQGVPNSIAIIISASIIVFIAIKGHIQKSLVKLGGEA